MFSSWIHVWETSHMTDVEFENQTKILKVSK